MTWVMHADEREAAAQLGAQERYDYFVTRCACWDEVWGLRDRGGWVTATGAGGRVFMPIWPHADFARACAIDGWTGATPAPISTKALVHGWLPDLQAKGRGVAVFPVPGGDAAPVDPADLRQDLEREAQDCEPG